MSQPCIFLGPNAGSMIIGCCGGKERREQVFLCQHVNKISEYASTSISVSGIANLEVNGIRSPAKVSACNACPLKSVAITALPVPILGTEKPVSRIQQAIEESRKKRWPANASERVVVIDCNSHGIGDAVIAVWIAEGAKHYKGEDPRVVLCAANERKEMLEIFGHDIHYPVAQSTKFAPLTNYMNGLMGQGSPPWAIARARAMGLSSTPIRPQVTIPRHLQEWARQPGNHSDVILFPQSTQRSRTWAPAKWFELHNHLTAKGLKVRVAEPHPTILKNVPVYTSKLRLAEMVAMIDESQLVIGNDSGPMHIAATVDKAAICVFGRTSDVTFSHARSVRAVQAEKRLVPCAGCWSGWGYDTKTCEQSCKALESIQPARVARLALEILAGDS